MAISPLSTSVLPAAPIQSVARPQAVIKAPQRPEQPPASPVAPTAASGDSDGDSDGSGPGSIIDVKA